MLKELMIKVVKMIKLIDILKETPKPPVTKGTVLGLVKAKKVQADLIKQDKNYGRVICRCCPWALRSRILWKIFCWIK